MKTFLWFLLVPAIVGCSTGATQVSTRELPAKDSSSVPSEETSGKAEEDPDAMREAIQAEIEQTASDFDETLARDYTIYSTYQGYENSSDGKWCMDSLLNPRFCEVNWNMEGTSGSYSFYFDDEDVLAGEERNSYNDYEEKVWIHTKFKPTYGFSATEGTENDSIPYFLQEADYFSKNDRAKEEFAKLILRIRELRDSVAMDDQEVTIRVQTTVNYGEDFTETEEYTLHQKLFDLIVNE